MLSMGVDVTNRHRESKERSSEKTNQWVLSLPQLESAAKADGMLHHPLPGLPDLSVPVYLKAGSLICKTDLAMMASHFPEYFINRVDVDELCGRSSGNEAVKVTLPGDYNEYVTDHIYGMVRINAGLYVDIKNLTNMQAEVR